MTQQQNTQQQDQGEPMSVGQMKSLVCKKLTQIFSSPLMEERLMKMAGGDASRVAKNLTSFLSVITQHDGGQRKIYYHQCSLQSLTMCFLESMNMQLPFDSRNLVSMIIYNYEAELDISYKGFIYALTKHYSNAYLDAKLVFEDDEFTCEESGGKAVFFHKATKPFRAVPPDFAGIAGAYCYFSYTTADGCAISRIVRMSQEDILKIKSKAKTQAVWNEFSSEMAIKAVLRRGSKIPFAAIDLDVDIEEVANKHFVLDAPSTGNRLAALMKAQEEVVTGTPAAPEPEGNAAPDSAPSDVGGVAAAKVEDDAPTPPIYTTGAPVEADSVPKTISEADFEDVTPPATEVTEKKTTEVWDGKTLFVGDGKHTVKDFDGAAAALVYLKKVIAARNHKKSRRAIINENPLLIAALIKTGQGGAVADLHKLADEGKE